jgi:hypothetical protein
VPTIIERYLCRGACSSDTSDVGRIGLNANGRFACTMNNHRIGFNAIVILLLKLKDQFNNGTLIPLSVKSDVTEKTLMSI